jgi:hypothetical protein
MAKYRALGMLFIESRLILAGEDFESDLDPGKNWHPMDDEAKAKCEKRAVPNPTDEPHGRTLPLVEIPDDWRDLSAAGQIAIAKKLGSPAKGTTREIAINRIETELAHRQTV